jgi:chromosome segregation ATPase
MSQVNTLTNTIAQLNGDVERLEAKRAKLATETDHLAELAVELTEKRQLLTTDISLLETELSDAKQEKGFSVLREEAQAMDLFEQWFHRRLPGGFPGVGTAIRNLCFEEERTKEAREEKGAAELALAEHIKESEHSSKLLSEEIARLRAIVFEKEAIFNGERCELQAQNTRSQEIAQGLRNRIGELERQFREKVEDAAIAEAMRVALKGVIESLKTKHETDVSAQKTEIVDLREAVRKASREMVKLKNELEKEKEDGQVVREELRRTTRETAKW